MEVSASVKGEQRILSARPEDANHAKNANVNPNTLKA
jgi:hypothetical protein